MKILVRFLLQKPSRQMVGKLTRTALYSYCVAERFISPRPSASVKRSREMAVFLRRNFSVKIFSRIDPRDNKFLLLVTHMTVLPDFW